MSAVPLTRAAMTLSRYSSAQLDAVRRLYLIVRRHSGTSGSNSAARLLLCLYNGPRFPFDLTDLRAFDQGNFEAAMTVIRMDAERTWVEVHALLDAIFDDGFYTGHEFEQWAYRMKLKGRCSKENLPENPARNVWKDDES